jgi:hydroxyacylglutathione hydrolase
MVTDRGGGADKPMGVATGDFVFVGDLGRPDLLESAAGFAGKADPSAHRLYQTVRKFMAWPDYLQVWPAHGAGSACGKALGAVPQSTVGYEKMFNASVLAAKTEQGFVDFILDAQPEPPLYFARMKRDNKMGPKVLGGVPTPRELSVDNLKTVVEKKAMVIDTRPWAAFKQGHLPGALHLPLNNTFNTDAGSLIDEHDVIHLIIEPSRVDEAVRDLIRVGLDQFVAAGGTLVPTAEITVSDARVLLDTTKPFVLDVRRKTEFAEGHIAGATNIAHTRLLSRLAEVPKDRPVLVNCRSGARSARACSLLQRHGYQVTNLAGGMLAWEAAKVPVEH